MRCNRLKSLVKNWYLQVQDEAMAPARMVDFITKHIGGCEECLGDPDVKEETEKIREIVLPAAKSPKTKEHEDEAETPLEEEEGEEGESDLSEDEEDEDVEEELDEDDV